MTTSQLISIQTGRIQTHILPDGKEWTTAYIKTPVSGAVRLDMLGLEGDEQKHKRFHGGEHRALLVYHAEHYPRWAQEVKKELSYGAFGENLVVSGLGDEADVCLGDVYQIGDTVRVQVAQPRQPCEQIYMALGIRGIRQRVDATARTGWYTRVLTVGTLEAGQTVTLLERPHPEWNIIRAQDAMHARKENREEALALADLEVLEPGWRASLRRG